MSVPIEVRSSAVVASVRSGGCYRLVWRLQVTCLGDDVPHQLTTPGWLPAHDAIVAIRTVPGSVAEGSDVPLHPVVVSGVAAAEGGSADAVWQQRAIYVAPAVPPVCLAHCVRVCVCQHLCRLSSCDAAVYSAIRGATGWP